MWITASPHITRIGTHSLGSLTSRCLKAARTGDLPSCGIFPMFDQWGETPLHHIHPPLKRSEKARHTSRQTISLAKAIGYTQKKYIFTAEGKKSTSLHFTRRTIATTSQDTAARVKQVKTRRQVYKVTTRY